MNIVQIEDAIYNWINGQLGKQAIFAYPNAPRPTTPYVLINLFQIIQNGTEEGVGELQPDKSTNNTYSTLKEVTISINTYYAGALQSAHDIRNSLSLTAVLDQLWIDGLGFLNAGNIQYLPEEIDSIFEQRAQFDITFAIRTEVIENIASVQNIELTNEIDETTIVLSNP